MEIPRTWDHLPDDPECDTCDGSGYAVETDKQGLEFLYRCPDCEAGAALPLSLPVLRSTKEFRFCQKKPTDSKESVISDESLTLSAA